MGANPPRDGRLQIRRPVRRGDRRAVSAEVRTGRPHPVQGRVRRSPRAVANRGAGGGRETEVGHRRRRRHPRDDDTRDVHHRLDRRTDVGREGGRHLDPRRAVGREGDHLPTADPAGCRIRRTDAAPMRREDGIHPPALRLHREESRRPVGPGTEDALAGGRRRSAGRSAGRAVGRRHQAAGDLPTADLPEVDLPVDGLPAVEMGDGLAFRSLALPKAAARGPRHLDEAPPRARRRIRCRARPVAATAGLAVAFLLACHHRRAVAGLARSGGPSARTGAFVRLRVNSWLGGRWGLDAVCVDACDDSHVVVFF